MVEPPKPSPFRGANDTDLVAALRKPGREDAARGNAAYPVQPFFLGRMFAVDYLDALRIQKRLDSLRETHSVLPDVLDFFFEIPFKFHRAEHTTLGGHRTDDRAFPSGRRRCVSQQPSLSLLHDPLCRRAASFSDGSRLPMALSNNSVWWSKTQTMWLRYGPLHGQ
jgi:hypothetical protein